MWVIDGVWVRSAQLAPTLTAPVLAWGALTLPLLYVKSPTR